MTPSFERLETAFEIASYEVDPDGKLSLFALFNRFQDLAGLHAEHLRVGYDLLRESNLAWVLSRIHVKILSLPDWGDSVRLVTWPKCVDRLFALRDFALTSDRGESLALATSAWLLVDIGKRRPQRIENLPFDLEFPDAPDAIRERPGKIPMPEVTEPVYEKPIRRSDVDTNGHVNNAQYVKWICDCFSEDQYRDRRIAALLINYLEETLPGDTIELQKTPIDDQAGECFVSGVSREKGSTVFLARIEWE